MHTHMTEDAIVPTFSEVQPKHKPLLVVTWCRAMVRYASSYILGHPERAQDVQTHLDQVLQLVGRKQTVRFDQDYCCQHAGNTYLYSSMRVDLYTKAMTRGQLLSQGMYNLRTYSNGGQSNFRPYSRQSNFRLYRGQAGKSIFIPSVHCIVYDTEVQWCIERTCPYSHSCFKRNVAKPHPAFRCGHNKTKGRSQPTKGPQTTQSSSP